MDPERLLVGVPRETFPGETRVALVPTVIPALVRAGMDVVVAADAGIRDVFEADIVAQVRTCGANPDAGRDDLEHLRPEQVVIGFADPLVCPMGVLQAAERKVTAFAMEFMPRISRAQSMDALSSQATVVGYKSVIMAADRLTK